MGRGRGSRDKLSITRTRGVSLARRHSGKKRARKRKTNDEIDAGAVVYERCKRVADDNRRRPDEKDPRIILPNNCISFRRLPLACGSKKLPLPHPFPRVLYHHLLVRIYLWNCIKSDFPSMYRFHTPVSKSSRETSTKLKIPFSSNLS